MASMFRALSASVSMPSPTSLAHFSNIQLLSSPSNAATYTTLAIVFALLALEQSVYRYKKRHLPGDSWTIPIIGKFADSMKPTMEGYMKQWNSGALSALSVFNMSVSLIAFSAKKLTFGCKL
jgi:sterol 22-desaturase